jgi:hypothetical protein
MRVALALLVAALVASPALPEPADDGGLFLTLLGVGVLTWLLAKGTSGGGGRVAAVVGGLVAVLVLLSLSFGLVASDLPAWVCVPAVVGFGVALLMARGLEGRPRR